ncbi:MAG TPA: hypothetical protein VGM67_04885 [Gemmatimonadaceae bacterium]|jgi:hypothetical protein
MPDFDLLFRGAPAGVIEYQGRWLRRAFDVSVSSGDRLDVFFERFTSRPVQGLGISLDDPRGALAIAGTTARSFALWTDSAPPHVACSILRVKAGGRLTVINQWRDEKYGTTLYAINAAAIDVRSQSDASAILHCSDGWGMEPNFGNLVVRLVLHRATEPRRDSEAAI